MHPARSSICDRAAPELRCAATELIVMKTDALMRAIAASALALLLAACATPAQRAAYMEREVDYMIQVYGPGCEKLGFKRDTDAWRDCVLRLATRESFERYSREPLTATCWGHRGFFHCSRF